MKAIDLHFLVLWKLATFKNSRETHYMLGFVICWDCVLWSQTSKFKRMLMVLIVAANSLFEKYDFEFWNHFSMPQNFTKYNESLKLDLKIFFYPLQSDENKLDPYSVVAEAYLGPSHTSVMQLFVKIVNGFFIFPEQFRHRCLIRSRTDLCCSSTKDGWIITKNSLFY